MRVALVLVHLQSLCENLLLQLAVSVQEVEGVLDEPSELKTKAAFVLHFRYTFALQKGYTSRKVTALVLLRGGPFHSGVAENMIPQVGLLLLGQ